MLTACSGEGDQANMDPVTLYTTVTQEAPEAHTPDPTPQPDSNPTNNEYGTDNAGTAYANAIAQVPDWNGYGWEPLDIDGYDPCAALSWQFVMLERGFASSPHYILLFHYGEYLGTATLVPYGFAADITRVSDDEIAVTYHYMKEGESLAFNSGTTEASFRWDEAQQKVLMSGEVPPQR